MKTLIALIAIIITFISVMIKVTFALKGQVDRRMFFFTALMRVVPEARQSAHLAVPIPGSGFLGKCDKPQRICTRPATECLK